MKKERRKQRRKVEKIVSGPLKLEGDIPQAELGEGAQEETMGLKDEAKTRFSIVYNEVDGCIRIFDLWHADISNLPMDKAINIKDDSPAVRVLTAEHVSSLIGWLKEKGWLEKYGVGVVGGVVQTAQASRKALQETAIESIRDITLGTGNGAGVNSVDGSVAKEATSAIREIMNKTLGG